MKNEIVFIVTNNEKFHRVFKKKKNAEDMVEFLTSKGYTEFKMFETQFNDTDWEIDYRRLINND